MSEVVSYRETNPVIIDDADNDVRDLCIIEGQFDMQLPHHTTKDRSNNILGPLPKGFSFKDLELTYIDEIHKLLTNHYIEDENGIVRLIYTKSFLYWYLKNVPINLRIGLIYDKKLVGLVVGTIDHYILYGKRLTLPSANLLCVQKNIRCLGLARYLAEELRVRLVSMNMEKYMFTSVANLSKPICELISYSIPINYDKLRSVEFLQGEFPELPAIDNNPLQILEKQDMSQLTYLLHGEYNKYLLKPDFTRDYVKNNILPKKNIIYSYIIKNDESITDFISVTQTYFYCIELGEFIRTANMTFYFHKTLSLRDLVCCLLDKLKKEGFDQLNFYNIMENDDIYMSKFETTSSLKVFAFNIKIGSIPNKKISVMIV